MTEVLKLDAEDIKKVIARHFHIDEKNIIKTQYSYLIEGISASEREEIIQDLSDMSDN